MCADVDVRMRMRMYECDRVPAYTALSMRIFYGVLPMQCTKLDAHVMICMCGCLDSVADMRMHMRICIHRIRIYRYEIADTGFHK